MTVPISAPPVNLACPDCGFPRFVFVDPETGPELVCDECFRPEPTAKELDKAFLDGYEQLRESIFRKRFAIRYPRVYRNH